MEILLPRVQALGSPVGLCGQRPSDDPAYAAFLVRAGIDSIFVAPTASPPSSSTSPPLKRSATGRTEWPR
ncbi:MULTISPECIES: hypothetical protein [unclassified Streptomyces]|uniref:hypothetical protein n=1 Tax=unclassified Streptomyces TaxID=2593676 RepID=UPI003B63FFFC